jgi:hypothetical protein
MGQFSVEKPGLPGSVLSGNQHADLQHKGLLCDVKDPMASLAAYLSDFRSELQNNGQGRWSTLKESAPDAEAPEPIESLGSGDQTGAV